jgi:metal-responsive CopG/Arc/MetJ family transcriptional regulator
MGKAKIAITLDERTVGRIDRLVRRKAYPNRSRAIEEAVEEKLDRLDRSRLARESANLDPAFEKAMAEEGLSEEIRDWPEY